MIVMSEPLLDGFDLYRTHDCGFTKPEEVSYGAWKGEDLLALVVFNVNEDVASEEGFFNDLCPVGPLALDLV